MSAAEASRSSARFDPEGNPGPYIAIVRNHLDSKYMGSLEVEILFSSSSGNSTNVPGRLAQVRYLSPFYGVTSYDGLTNNAGFKYTQKSYGMWMVPPDVGSRVLVIFVEGNRGNGFWIGCVQDDYMNMMVPAVTPATTYNEQDPSTKLPVGEYNKKRERGTGNDPTKYIKPVNTDALAILDEQGLSSDETRGLTTSSARREVPSTVFGVSTPGPQDRRSGSPGIRYGENFAQAQAPFNRLGGSSFVMDDGDPSLLRKSPASEGPYEYVNVEAGETGGNVTIPHNEMVKIKTRTGHQILLHNSEDLIYIANARGTTWIELTSNGKIDIYAQDSISIHTENDLNVTADRDINFNAGRDIHFNAGQNVFQTAGSNWEIKAGADGKITCGGNSNIKSAHHIESAGKIDMNGPAAAEAADANVPSRVPQHEPWSGHENFNPSAHTPDNTNGTTTPEESSDSDPMTTPDTFRKSVTREVGSNPPAQPAEEGEEDSGVIQSSEEGESAAEPPAEVSAATDAVVADPTPANVSTLDSAIDTAVSVGSMGFAAAQTVISRLDNAFSPSSLRSVVDAGVALYDSARVAASEGLLAIRTKLARINTP